MAKFNIKLNNVVNFLDDIPNELTVTVVKRDLHMKEATGTKNESKVRKTLISMLKYFFSHKRLASMLIESGKEI